MLWTCFSVAFFGVFFCVLESLRWLLLSQSRDCLQVSDLSVDKLSFPSFVRLFIKVAKSDPFKTSCVIVVRRNDSLILHLRGSNPGPLFVFESGSPLT